jgi:hypothetical protein
MGERQVGGAQRPVLRIIEPQKTVRAALLNPAILI